MDREGIERRRDIGYDVVSVGYDVVSVGYDIVSVRYNDLSARNNVVGVRSRGIGIDCKFSLGTGGQGCKRRSDRTYVEDLKDPVEFSPPGRDLFFIDPRVEKVRNRVPLATPSLPLTTTISSSA